MNSKGSPPIAERLQGFAHDPNRHSREEVTTPPQQAALGEQGSNREEPTLSQVSAQLLEAIQTCTASLTSKIEEVKIDVGLLRQDMQNLRDRVRETEARISLLEDNTAPITPKLAELEKAASLWSQRADDLENRLRRNNIRILGLPERAEGSAPCEFMERWLKELLPDAKFSSAYAVERAHRVPARPPPPGASPRPMLARLLSSKDRDIVLQTARRMQELKFENTTISIFPDFSAALQKTRATFVQIKRRLRDASIQYSMAYPARLRVIYKDRTFFFNTPAETEEWLNQTLNRQRN